MKDSRLALVVVGVLLGGAAGCGGESAGPIGPGGQTGGAGGRGGTAGGAAGRGAAGTGGATAGAGAIGGGLPCFEPSDCAGDGALSCCVSFTEGSGTVSCRPTATCLGEGGYLACVTAEDCPPSQPCVLLTEVMGRPFSICGGVSGI